jgi:hypothetical protein
VTFVFLALFIKLIIIRSKVRNTRSPYFSRWPRQKTAMQTMLLNQLPLAIEIYEAGRATMLTMRQSVFNPPNFARLSLRSRIFDDQSLCVVWLSCT